jgi:hypothetical protein
MRSLLVLTACLLAAVSHPVAANGGDDAGMLVAQAKQLSAQEMLDGRRSLEEVKAQLDKRRAELEKDWQELAEAQEAIAQKQTGQTLRGSKARKYVQDTAAFNKAMTDYTRNREELERDIQVYNAAVRAMQTSAPQPAPSPTAATPQAQGQGGLPPAQLNGLRQELHGTGVTIPLQTGNQEELSYVNTQLTRIREEILAEYRKLRAEKQAIAATSQSARDRARGDTGNVGAQVADVNARIAENARSRKRYNDAVKSYNATTGQNVQLLPRL